MGFTQATHPVQSSHPRQGEDESVRITAATRHEVLFEFLSKALVEQRAVTEGERVDRNATDSVAPRGFFTTADLRVSNAAAVQQWIASNLAAYSGNREFRAVTR